ncbi:MAG: homoserine dehydrogenase [Anaerovoracaceae bacterium]
MKVVKVGLLGIGNIGKGTYRTLELNKEKIKKSVGLDIEIVKILNRHPEKDRGIDIPKEKYVTDVDQILNDPEIDIVIELIGGIEPATEYMAAALSRGKGVVTANKAAIAANGQKLQQLAQENKTLLRFEASVGGGIPILTALTNPLLANEFSEIHGILNGTTNYILTQMSEYGKDYAEVLKDAQEKGFAEADPTADVEGLDAANKLSILISLVFGLGVGPEEIPTQGITSIEADDINFATEFEYKVKLLASARKEGGRVSCNVEPALVPVDHPLASVSNEFNAVFVTGNAVDNLMFYGRGAGPMPTGSAVMGDVIDIARQLDKGAAFDPVAPLQYDADLEYAGEGANKYYIRVKALDEPGVLGKISTTLGSHNVGIESMIQRSGGNDQGVVPLIFIVHKVEKTVLDKALEDLKKNKYVESVDNVLRVEE